MCRNVSGRTWTMFIHKIVVFVRRRTLAAVGTAAWQVQRKTIFSLGYSHRPHEYSAQVTEGPFKTAGTCRQLGKTLKARNLQWDLIKQ